MFKSTKNIGGGRMIGYYSTDEIASFNPASVGDLLFWFDGKDADSYSWTDRTNTYTLDTSSVTITNGYAVFSGSQMLPVGFLPVFSKWTVAALVKPVLGQGEGMILSNDASGSQNDVYFGINSSDSYFVQYQPSSPLINNKTIDPDPANGDWATVVFVANSNTATLYVNGVSAVTSTQSWEYAYGDSTKQTGIGARPVGSSYWNGNIKDVLFYQNALTSGDIIQLHKFLIDGLS